MKFKPRFIVYSLCIMLALAISAISHYIIEPWIERVEFYYERDVAEFEASQIVYYDISEFKIGVGFDEEFRVTNDIPRSICEQGNFMIIRSSEGITNPTFFFQIFNLDTDSWITDKQFTLSDVPAIPKITDEPLTGRRASRPDGWYCLEPGNYKEVVSWNFIIDGEEKTGVKASDPFVIS